MWKAFDSSETFLEALKLSQSGHNSFAIFKHSSSCGFSAIAKRRFEMNFPQGIPIYLLIVQQQRGLSNQVAEELDVVHESPQLLFIENGACTYSENHLAISASELSSRISPMNG